MIRLDKSWHLCKPESWWWLVKIGDLGVWNSDGGGAGNSSFLFSVAVNSNRCSQWTERGDGKESVESKKIIVTFGQMINENNNSISTSQLEELETTSSFSPLVRTTKLSRSSLILKGFHQFRFCPSVRLSLLTFSFSHSLIHTLNALRNPHIITCSSSPSRLVHTHITHHLHLSE